MAQSSVHHRFGFVSGFRPSYIITLSLALLCVMPLGALVWGSFAQTSDTWEHIFTVVLPSVLGDTLLLLLGVGAFTMAIGVACAWLVSQFDFPGRKFFSWALFLPLVVPTYIAAYIYAEILDIGGVVQQAARALWGVKLARDLHFWNIHSLSGVIFVFTLVLYPYVYMTVRVAFVIQSRSLIEEARTLGCSAMQSFWKVALPLARPAIVAGVALVIMESLNDLGAVVFLGVRTLSVTIYTAWVYENNLAAACQVALMLLLFIAAVLAVERLNQRSIRQLKTHRASSSGYHREKLKGWVAVTAFLSCAIPLILGFIVPAAYLTITVISQFSYFDMSLQFELMSSSVILALSVASATVLAAIFLNYFQRVHRGIVAHIGLEWSRWGYAVAGAVLAIGVLIPMSRLDVLLAHTIEYYTGERTKLWLSSLCITLGAALFIRLLPVALSTVETGYRNISTNMDGAARTLGCTNKGVFRRVHFPLLSPAMIAGFILVFVDTLKELPMTLILRPFNFETLATYVHQTAVRDAFNDGALAALMIILFCIVLALHGAFRNRYDN